MAAVTLLMAGCGGPKPYIGQDLELEYDSDYPHEVVLEHRVGNGGIVTYDIPAHTDWKAMGLTCQTPKQLWVRAVDPYEEGKFDASQPSTPPGVEIDRKTWTDLQCPAAYTLTIDAKGKLALKLDADGRYDA